MTSTTCPTKKWKRWTEVHRHFPKNKYNFSTHLKKVGDYVVTYPMEKADCIRIKDAAKAWAYYHKKRIKSEILYATDTTSRMRITLISQHRLPQYDL